VGELEIAWRSPTYYHCNFTALPSLTAVRAAAWSEALLAMSYDEPSLRQAMDLEGVKRWLPADKSGYADLTEAMRQHGLLE
jgi:ABC-type phosphate/phosphonate transport system substrate-binding protein